MPRFSDLDDAELVQAVLEGNRDAYGVIVTRYQRLLCSIAYASAGDLGSSEDLAQECFVEGWKRLGTLKEPAKLKSWLCGILRFKLSHFRRKESRQPVAHSVDLDEAAELESEEQIASTNAMNDEEQALLWQALQTVPQLYREPLVLYYREHRSIEHVAAELDLTENAVKQRLSRGRKLLKDRMMVFVEDALERSTPGKVFTAAVLAALPAVTPAKALGATAGALKVGSWFKWTALAAFVASISGFISAFFAVRTNLEQSRTPLERKSAVKAAIVLIGLAVGLVIAVFGLRMAALQWWEQRSIFAIAAQVIGLVFVLYLPFAFFRINENSKALRTAERLRSPESFDPVKDAVGSAAGEFRSKTTLFGVPLVHIRYALADKGQGPVFGWIAAGDCAIGLLVAWGGVAIAPISVGIISVGVLTCGALGLGGLAVGTVAVGMYSLGAMAYGFEALGSISALGWKSAAGGGFALARDFALGPVAFAEHVNDPVANAAVESSWFTSGLGLIFTFLSIAVIAPVVLYSRAVKRRLGRLSK